MNITKKLQLWENAQLISAKQKEAILSYEQKRTRPLLYSAFLFISAFSIGTGILSLIGYNWDKIPDFLKLTMDFLILALCGTALYKFSEQKKKIWTESLKFLYALLILVTIGLIGQIYHLGGDLNTALLFWSLITFPLVLSCQKVMLPLLWLYVFYTTTLTKLLEIDLIQHYFEQIMEISPFWPIWMNLMLYLGIAELISKFSVNKKIVQAINIMFVMNIVGSILFTEIFLPLDKPQNLLTDTTQYLIFGSLWLISIALWSLSFVISRQRAQSNKRQPYYLLLGVLGLIMIILNIIYGQENDLREILTSLLSFSGLITMMYIGHKKNNKKIINLGAILISLRFFIIYIQVFGNMMTTGLGLITSGIIFYLIGLSITKINNKFQQRLEENRHE